MKGKECWIGVCGVLLLVVFQESSAANKDVSVASVEHSHSLSAVPVVIEAGELASLMGTPVKKIRLAAYTGAELVQIPFQIDRKDEKGLYVIENGPNKRRAGSSHLDENDEITFMAFDAGEEIEAGVFNSEDHIRARIGVEDISSRGVKWVYVLNDVGGEAENSEGYVVYENSDDSISTDIYRLGFSSDRPFLVNELKLAGSVEGEWSENVVDTMKLKQLGKLFGVIDFERNHGDYASNLVAVKDGPIRVIRQTSNKVRILWALKSPEVLIDYIAHKNGFQMDIVIDIPFRIGLFFDDVESIATIDWREVAVEKGFFLRHNSTQSEHRINGKMTDEERQLNEYPDTDIAIISDYGRIEVDLEISDGSPILKKSYYRDDSEAEDPPENVPGQHGNVGFKTYNWEKLSTAVSHMFFNAHIFKRNESRIAAKAN